MSQKTETEVKVKLKFTEKLKVNTNGYQCSKTESKTEIEMIIKS